MFVTVPTDHADERVADGAAIGSAGTPQRSFAQVAATPKMLVLLVVLLTIAAGCAMLGQWQLGRAFERASLASDQARLEQQAGGPAPIGEVLAPQSKFTGALVGRAVTVGGQFETGQFYVANRALNDRSGYLVLAGLRVSDDGIGGESWQSLSGAPVLPVVRGWAASLDEARAATVPSGFVSVTAYLQGAEAGGRAPDEGGVITTISSPQLLNYWEGPIYAAYGVLADQVPPIATDLELLPRPQIDGGESMNLRNLFYAIEWWIFGAFAVALWLRMVRDERLRGSGRVDLDRILADAAGTGADGPDGVGPGATGTDTTGRREQSI